MNKKQLTLSGHRKMSYGLPYPSYRMLRLVIGPDGRLALIAKHVLQVDAYDTAVRPVFDEAIGADDILVPAAHDQEMTRVPAAPTATGYCWANPHR